MLMFYTYRPSTPATTSTANVPNVPDAANATNENAYEKKNYTARYDDNTWFELIKNAVKECVADNVPVNTLNVEERLKDLFGFKIGKIYTYEVTTPDGNTRYAYEACHKKIIRKMLKRLITSAAAL